MTGTFFTLFLISGLINFACSILIIRQLNNAGVKTGFYEMRWQIHKHLKSYQKIQMEKYGEVGGVYYGYVISGCALIVFALLTFVSLAP